MAAALVLAVAVGLSLGMLGGGGSTLALPILLYVLDLPEAEAITSSLLVVGATSAVAAGAQYRAGNLDVRVGLLFAAGGAVGAAVGGALAASVPGPWLVRGFVVMMLGTAFAMLRGRAEASEAPPPMPAAVAVGVGLGLGTLTGLLGAGGGFVVVPALVLVGGLPMRRAAGTSLMVIATQSFAGLASHLSHTRIDLAVSLALAAAAVGGSLVGIRLSVRVPAAALRRAFGVLILAVAVFMASKQL